MCEKTFKKLNKVLLGIFVFFIAGMGVSAEACDSAPDDFDLQGNTKAVAHEKCKQTTQKSGDKTYYCKINWVGNCVVDKSREVVNKSNNSNWTSKSLSGKVNEKIKLTSDTSWCSFSNSVSSQKSSSNASLSTSGHSCYFTATKAGTYTAYDIYQGTKKYKYTITVSDATGPFCGTGKSAMESWSGNTQVTESECNGYKNSTWYSVWNSSSNCCSVTKRSSSSGSSGSSSSSSSSSSTGTTPTTYKVLFDQNYGFGLECDAGFTVPTAGVCEKSGISKGTTVNFPASSSSMYRTEGGLIGWTKLLYDGQPNCSKGAVIKDNSTVIDSNTDFYACYKETIGGYRFVQEGYVADGGSVDWSCGQEMFIEYCTKENGTDYCYYYENSTNTYRKVYRNKLSTEYDGVGCNNETTDNVTEDKGYQYATIDGDKFSCGDRLYITTCSDGSCNFTKIKTTDNEISEDGTIDKKYLVDSESSANKVCKKSESASCSNMEMTGMMSEDDSYSVCYDENDSEAKIKKTIKKYYVCDENKGYYFDDTAVVATGKETCSDNGDCTRTYKVSCTKGTGAKPTLSVKSGLVQSNGYGTITVTAYPKDGTTIDSYFYSDNYLAPTDSNKWQSVSGNTFTIEHSPGVIYIWVRDSKGNISSAVTGAVLDTTNSNTTINKLALYDANGNIQVPVSSGTAYNVGSVKNNNYVRLSNDLSKDSNVVADAFNPFDMEYKLEVSSPTVSVYATLTSTDSKYVDGYEPRTVNLSYGVNTVLIKIQNNEGVTRTYTILVTRTDDRTSDNTLSDISLSVGNINFNANVTDYKIEIPSTTKNVDINSVIASDKASYVSGYEPGVIDIIGDTTVKLIKVKSETGSTRTYVLTFIKEGTDEISKESLQLRDLVIPGVYIPFEDNVSNYSLSVDYETDVINLNTVLKDKDSIASISLKRKSDSEYRLTSSIGIGLDVGENFIEIQVVDTNNEESYYRLTIIRKEFGLSISDDTALKDLKVLGYDIKFEPSKKEYTVRIKQEKSLVITAVPNSNRAEVFIRGNDELTGFSTVRVKVVAENGKFETYSIDIKKDAFNKTIEIASIVAGVVIILVSSGIIIIKKKSKANREYFEE